MPSEAQGFVEVEVPGVGIVEVPSDMPMTEVQSTLAKQFPARGEDIAERVQQEPDWRPTKPEFKKYEDYQNEKPSDLAGAASAAVEHIGNVIGKAASTALEPSKVSRPNFEVPKILNPLNYVEGLTQGTLGMGEVLMDSADPSSMQFKTEAFLKGHKTLDDRYQQFLAAREVAARNARLASGQTTAVIPKNYVDPEVTQAVSNVGDLTMLIPGLDALSIGGKVGRALSLPSRLATKAVGLGTELTGKGINLAAKPLERGVARVGEMVTEATGMSAEQLARLRNVATSGAVGGALAGVPGGQVAAGIAAIPHAIQTARGLGDVLEGAGRNLATEQPGRIGAMESLGRLPNATPAQRMIGAIGAAGGDQVLDAVLHTAAGALTGAGIGGGLGWWSGGAEGAAGGAAAGAALGGPMALGGRVVGHRLGTIAKEARRSDLKRFVERQNADTQAKLKRVIERDGADATIQMLDGLETLTGALKDAKVNWLNDAEFKARNKGVSGRGVAVVEGGIPTIDVNVDFKRTPETVAHEMFHVFRQIEQLKPEMEVLKRKLVGAYDENGNKVADGALSDGQINTLFQKYYDVAPPQTKKEMAAMKTPAEKAELVFNEAGAEHFSRLVAGSSPDALLRGFGGATRKVLDRLITQHTDSLLGRIAQRIGGPDAGIESMLFGKDLPEAPPVVQAMMRDLVRARAKMKERIQLPESDRAYKRSEPIPAGLADELKNAPIPLVKRNVDNTYTIRSDAELQAEEQKFNQSLKQALDSAPVTDPTKPHMRLVDGQLTGDGFSKEQKAAIAAHPDLNDRTKQMILRFGQAMEDGTVQRVTYGPASRKDSKGRTRYGTMKIHDADLIPYKLYQNKEGGWVQKAVDLTEAQRRARDLASKGNLGPYGNSFKSFLHDFTAYLANSSDRAGTPTKDFFMARGDSATDAQAKKDFMHQFLGEEQQYKKLVKDYRLDRMLAVNPTGEKVPFRELAWERMKAHWMPAEKVGDSEVITSQEGMRITRSPKGNWRLYEKDGSLHGIYETQAKAEAVADSLSPAKDIPQGRASTRAPWLADPKESVLKGDLAVGMDVARTDPAYMQKLTAALEPRTVTYTTKSGDTYTRELFNFMRDFKGTQEERLAQFKQHLVDNLLWLHDQFAPALRQRAKLWYDGARRITDEWAARFNKSPEAIAAVLATLSPQRHWFHNVRLAQLVLEAPERFAGQKANDQMLNWIQSYAKGDADTLAGQVRGKKFEQMSPLGKAAFLRAHDALYGERGVPIVLPEGEITNQRMRNDDGAVSGLTWGSFDQVEKAFTAATDPGMRVISDLLGGEHKVRNFYNNILNPNDARFGDVTVDTHAVAGALLEPLAGKDMEVLQNFGSAKGSPASGELGLSGTYAMYADAYREAAKLRGLLPREMQSITWEAVRALFTDTLKTPENSVFVKDLWKQYAEGHESLASIREKIVNHFGGFKDPDWVRTPAGGNQRDSGGIGEGGQAGDQGQLSGSGVRRSSIPADRGRRVYDPEILARELARWMPDPGFPGASSFAGYRILPSKQGNFRVYAPTGALIGVQTSEDKAQQLVRRKAGVEAQ